MRTSLVGMFGRPDTIRRAYAADAPDIAHVHVLAWREAYAGVVPHEFLEGLSIDSRTEWWRTTLLAEETNVIVAIKGGRLVGWISFGPNRDEDAVDTAEIYAIYILADHWRRGIGSELLKAAEPSFSGFSSIVLWVLAENKRALAFYRNHGFEPDGATKQIEIGGAHLREVRLGRRAQRLQGS
ncbi:mycothiol acetyltransferase [mine drainage metagenome]|uniref:Mycothiol acetyltransferase n=1 Tax=mine drainage metagenome TaxID=410659 RepID=A0A1J5QPU5_9ZZZZ